jgi:hypothetical protein
VDQIHAAPEFVAAIARARNFAQRLDRVNVVQHQEFVDKGGPTLLIAEPQLLGTHLSPPFFVVGAVVTALQGRALTFGGEGKPNATREPLGVSLTERVTPEFC